MRLSGTYIGARFSDLDLTHWLLDGTFVGVTFVRVTLCRAKITGSFLAVTFSDTDLEGAILDPKSFMAVRFKRSILPDGSMSD